MTGFQENHRIATGYCWLRAVVIFGMLMALSMISRLSWSADETINAQTSSKEEWRFAGGLLGREVAPEGKEIWPLLDLEVDSNGFRHMLFYDQRVDLFRYWYQRGVREWRPGVFGGVYLEYGADKKAKSEVPVSPDTARELDRRNKPHIIWKKERGIHYMTPKGKDPKKRGWIHSVIGDRATIFPKLAVSSKGIPYVLYFGYQKKDRGVKLASMQDGEWKIESLGIKPSGDYDITAGNNDEIIVAVCYASDFPDEDHRLVLLTKSEDKWVQEEIATLDFLTNYPSHIKVLVDPDGNPHVFYSNGRVAYREDDVIYEEFVRKENKWQRQGIVRIRPGIFILTDTFSVDISPDGKSFVCYADMNSGLYLVEKKGDKWQEHLLDTTKDIIKTSIAAINSSEVSIAFLSNSKETPGLFQVNFERVKSE